MYNFNHNQHRQAAEWKTKEAGKEIRDLLSRYPNSQVFFADKLTFRATPEKLIRSYLAQYFIALANTNKVAVRPFASSFLRANDTRIRWKRPDHAHFVAWVYNPNAPITCSAVKNLWKHGIANISEVHDLDRALRYCFDQHEIETFNGFFFPRGQNRLIA